MWVHIHFFFFFLNQRTAPQFLLDSQKEFMTPEKIKNRSLHLTASWTCVPFNRALHRDLWEAVVPPDFPHGALVQSACLQVASWLESSPCRLEGHTDPRRVLPVCCLGAGAQTGDAAKEKGARPPSRGRQVAENAPSGRLPVPSHRLFCL